MVTRVVALNMKLEISAQTVLDLLRQEEILATGEMPGAEDDLLECGLDSMALMQMMVAVETAFGVALGPEDLTLEHVRTARLLADRISHRATNAP